MNLDNKDALELARALQSAGTNIDGLKAVNPYAVSDTPRSRQIRWTLEASNPTLANKFKKDAGHESMIPSLSYAASQAAGVTPENMGAEAAADYARFNPQAMHDQKIKEENNLINKWEGIVEANQRKREGDRNYEQRIANEKIQEVKAAERRAEGEALSNRLAQRQAEMKNSYARAMNRANGYE